MAAESGWQGGAPRRKSGPVLALWLQLRPQLGCRSSMGYGHVDGYLEGQQKGGSKGGKAAGQQTGSCSGFAADLCAFFGASQRWRANNKELGARDICTAQREAAKIAGLSGPYRCQSGVDPAGYPSRVHISVLRRRWGMANEGEELGTGSSMANQPLCSPGP